MHSCGELDVSDTRGVNFGPYLQTMLPNVKENWYHSIPESAERKKGKLAVEFAITNDGKLADMRLVTSAGDAALDRPVLDSIAASHFSPLTMEFGGPSLELRLLFCYNPRHSRPFGKNRDA
jgi:TonB family protein